MAKSSHSHTSWQRTWISQNHFLTPSAEMKPLCVSPPGNSHVTGSADVMCDWEDTDVCACLTYIVHQPGCIRSRQRGPQHTAWKPELKAHALSPYPWAHTQRYRILTSQANQNQNASVHFANPERFWDHCTASWHLSHCSTILLASALSREPAKWRKNAKPIPPRWAVTACWEGLAAGGSSSYCITLR